MSDRLQRIKHKLAESECAVPIYARQDMEWLVEAIAALTSERDELRKAIQHTFCLNPDTSDGTELIGRYIMPMPEDVRLKIIAECMRAEAAAKAASET